MSKREPLTAEEVTELQAKYDQPISWGYEELGWDVRGCLATITAQQAKIAALKKIEMGARMAYGLLAAKAPGSPIVQILEDAIVEIDALDAAPQPAQEEVR